MKTALQELIERLERHSMELKGDEKTIQADGAIRMCIIEATELLEKERKAFLKGYEYANKQPEVDYQKMFANCSLPNETHKFREAAENIIKKWKCKCAITSSDIQKLEKALK